MPPSVAARFLVGEVTDDGGGTFLMIVNKDLTYSFQFEIAFKRPVARSPGCSGSTPTRVRKGPFEGQQSWVSPGGGVLLKIE